MKKLICALCAAAMGLSAFAYDVVENTKMAGNVRSVTKTTYTISQKFGDYFRTPNAKFVSTYDGAGRQIDSIELTPRDVVVNKVSNIYDVAGYLVEQDAYDPDGALLWKSITTYANGKKADRSEYSKDGSLRNKVIYSYTGNNLTDETYYNAEGALARKVIYTYGITGLLEKETEYFGDGVLDEERTYEWNTMGKIDSISTVYGDGTTEKEVFRYNGNVLSEVTTYDSTNRVTNRLLVKCDSIGNITKVTTYSVVKKFGQIMNEMTDMVEYIYSY